MEGRGWVSIVEDVSEWRQAQAQILHMERHDALTDLPNRRVFREHLDLVLSRISRTDGEVAVHSLDLDHFKVINDSLGHPIGDDLPKSVDLRLIAGVRDTDCVARFGGDEFDIVQFKDRELVPSVNAALSDSMLAANRLELEITESVFLEGGQTKLEILHTLREHGIRILMDDFGTGYSSLSYLRSFPFDTIKIDASFCTSLLRATTPLPSFARSPGSHGVWASRAQRKA
jgi:diguanylate cyclase (GGDEF)-like protein